jgi:hypothetical protein
MILGDWWWLNDENSWFWEFERFQLAFRFHLLPPTRSERSVIDSHLSEPTISESRLKSVRFLVGESSVDVASSVDGQTIKINHQLNLPPPPPLKIVTYLTDLTSYIVPQKHVHRPCHQKNPPGWIRHQLNDSYANYHVSHAPHSSHFRSSHPHLRKE